jgi:integrase
MFGLKYASMTIHDGVGDDWDVLVTGFLCELAAAGRPATTVQLRRGQLSFIRRSLGVTVGDVSREVLLSWLASHSWSPDTRRSYVAVLRVFFGWAYENGHLGENPAARLPVIKPSGGRPRPIPDDAYAVALAGADARVALMLRCAVEAGLRRGEIARLHVQDLLQDACGHSVLVHGKGGKDRIIPIPDALAVDLRRSAAWVFPSARGGHVSARWVGQVCAAVIPTPWTLHSCRHRYATRAYAGTRDLRSVQTLLGHTSPGITQRYVAVTATDLRAAMDAANTEETERE